jgi:SAM-dependent methyltransferase
MGIEQRGIVASADYGPQYYASHCGPIPYDRSHDQWERLFGNIADELIRLFRPARVFDAGCAHGFLVEALWDRGVEAWGRDISEFAISQVRPDVRRYCSVGSLTAKIEDRFDLVVCIEVLEHMPEAEAARAVANMTSVTDRIVFSSSPTDFNEPTHVNINPAIYWLRLFAAHGFAPVPTTTLPSITPYVLVLERSEVGREDRNLIICAELIWQRLQFAEARETMSRLRSEIADLGDQIGAVRSSTSWRLTAPVRAITDHALPSLRRRSRQAMKVLWWCATLQVAERLRHARHASASFALVSSQPIRVGARRQG